MRILISYEILSYRSSIYVLVHLLHKRRSILLVMGVKVTITHNHLLTLVRSWTPLYLIQSYPTLNWPWPHSLHLHQITLNLKNSLKNLLQVSTLWSRSGLNVWLIHMCFILQETLGMCMLLKLLHPVVHQLICIVLLLQPMLSWMT